MLYGIFRLSSGCLFLDDKLAVTAPPFFFFLQLQFGQELSVICCLRVCAFASMYGALCAKSGGNLEGGIGDRVTLGAGDALLALAAGEKNGAAARDVTRPPPFKAPPRFFSSIHGIKGEKTSSGRY
jgi:hypothetical protein